MKENRKKKLLWQGLLYDAIGMLTMAIPVVGPALDVLWAPYAGSQMLKMYPNKKGKIASIIVFIEEILPYTDYIPTFTIMWIYTFIFAKNTKGFDDGKTIDIKMNDD